MKLRALVRGSITAVNRDKLIVWLKSQGPVLFPGGVATPTYAPAKPVLAQIQPLPTDQLAHMEQLNIQGVLRQVYLRNAVASSVREDGTGGDLLQFPELWTPEGMRAMTDWIAQSQIPVPGSPSFGAQPVPPAPVKTWRVMQVPEQWDDGCNVIVRMQSSQNNAFAAGSTP